MNRFLAEKEEAGGDTAYARAFNSSQGSAKGSGRDIDDLGDVSWIRGYGSQTSVSASPASSPPRASSRRGATTSRGRLHSKTVNLHSSPSAHRVVGDTKANDEAMALPGSKIGSRTNSFAATSSHSIPVAKSTQQRRKEAESLKDLDPSSVLATSRAGPSKARDPKVTVRQKVKAIPVVNLVDSDDDPDQSNDPLLLDSGPKAKVGDKGKEKSREKLVAKGKTGRHGHSMTGSSTTSPEIPRSSQPIPSRSKLPPTSSKESTATTEDISIFDILETPEVRQMIGFHKDAGAPTKGQVTEAGAGAMTTGRKVPKKRNKAGKDKEAAGAASSPVTEPAEKVEHVTGARKRDVWKGKSKDITIQKRTSTTSSTRPVTHRPAFVPSTSSPSRSIEPVEEIDSDSESEFSRVKKSVGVVPKPAATTRGEREDRRARKRARLSRSTGSPEIAEVVEPVFKMSHPVTSSKGKENSNTATTAARFVTPSPARKVRASVEVEVQIETPSRKYLDEFEDNTAMEISPNKSSTRSKGKGKAATSQEGPQSSPNTSRPLAPFPMDMDPDSLPVVSSPSRAGPSASQRNGVESLSLEEVADVSKADGMNLGYTDEDEDETMESELDELTKSRIGEVGKLGLLLNGRSAKKHCLEFQDTVEICPYCEEPLPKHPSQALQQAMSSLANRASEAMDVDWTDSISICNRHRAETIIIPLGERAGYPTIINVQSLEKRIIKPGIVAKVEEIINQPKKSGFHHLTKLAIREAGSRRQWMTMEYQREEKELARLQPGYYGDIGRATITQIFTNHFTSSGLYDLTIIKPLHLSDFISNVIVPEVAILLVLQDLGLPDVTASREERAFAIAVVKESVDYGRVKFPVAEIGSTQRYPGTLATQPPNVPTTPSSRSKGRSSGDVVDLTTPTKTLRPPTQIPTVDLSSDIEDMDEDEEEEYGDGGILDESLAEVAPWNPNPKGPRPRPLTRHDFPQIGEPYVKPSTSRGQGQAGYHTSGPSLPLIPRGYQRLPGVKAQRRVGIGRSKPSNFRPPLLNR